MRAARTGGAPPGRRPAVAGSGGVRHDAVRRRVLRAPRAQAAGAAAAGEEGPPPGCARYTVELRKPLGFVLEQKSEGSGIFVAAITPGGSADKTRQLTVGDQLISCSGVTYGRLEEYGGVKVRAPRALCASWPRARCLGALAARGGARALHEAATRPRASLRA